MREITIRAGYGDVRDYGSSKVLKCPLTGDGCNSRCAWFGINDGGLTGFSDKTISKVILCRDRVIGIIVK
jgi:hypothetical protein